MRISCYNHHREGLSKYANTNSNKNSTNKKKLNLYELLELKENEYLDTQAS